MKVTSIAKAKELLEEFGYTLDLLQSARRERIATACFAGLLSREPNRETREEMLAAKAVICADLLIKELDK